MKCWSQPPDGVVFLMKNSTICWLSVVLWANASKLLQTLFNTISISVLFLLQSFNSRYERLVPNKSFLAKSFFVRHYSYVWNRGLRLATDTIRHVLLTILGGRTFKLAMGLHYCPCLCFVLTLVPLKKEKVGQICRNFLFGTRFTRLWILLRKRHKFVPKMTWVDRFMRNISHESYWHMFGYQKILSKKKSRQHSRT